MRRKLVLLLHLVKAGIATSALIAALASARSAAPIVIRGKQRERSQARRSGQSLLVKPEEASRFDTLSHLRRESSLVAPENGRISPSGFVVPKIRGQDVKLTDVYLEDILLQDPYSGLPLLEDLDLRAFGSLELHQGVAPPELGTLNPIGTLRYRFREAAASSLRTGLQAGDIYGHSLWHLGVYHEPSPGKETDARVYVRHHQSSGRYPYYSDEGTPFNVSDDRIRVRENNDQKSWQVVPYLRQRMGPYRLQGFAWFYRAERGLPALSAVVPSAARERPDGALGNLQLEREFSLHGPFSQARVSFALTESRDRRRLEDPGRNFLGLAEQGNMQVQSRRLRAHTALSGAVAEVFCSLESTGSAVKNHLGRRLAVDLRRRSNVVTLGSRLSPFSLASIEVKALQREQRDSTDGAAAVEATQDEKSLQGAARSSLAASLCVALGNDEGGIYLQSASAARLPSLSEEFGDGASIRANRDLLAEDTHHREIGGFVKGREGGWRLGAAAYEDRSGNKIILVPVLANALKAMNVRKTKIRGYDLRSELSWQSTTVYVNYSRLFPYDVTRASRLLLPGVAERIWAAEAEQRWGSVSLRWLTRYRSAVFRDLSNSLELPGAWIHDASIDYKTTPWGSSELRVGLSSRNVFNLISVEIRAPDTAINQGRTAFSDMAGAPLPGRQWLFSLDIAL